MTVTVSYPPHPAEGRRYSPLGLAEAEPPVRWPAATASTPGPAPGANAPTVSPAPADHRQHWLTYDPSLRSQYPVD